MQCKKALELDPNDREVVSTYIKALSAGRQLPTIQGKVSRSRADVFPYLNGSASVTDNDPSLRRMGSAREDQQIKTYLATARNFPMAVPVMT
ncbi:hypothetical protein DD237_004978 [Peronospora effusa]|uniref:Uncharacterized protein n=1 Tax=Peronospora effusa TaxID=542832 RepID=A0A425CDE3_9STRA|nr:hypothetical protein DD237_004978 [Peronospora effusa]